MCTPLRPIQGPWSTFCQHIVVSSSTNSTHFHERCQLFIHFSRTFCWRHSWIANFSAPCHFFEKKLNEIWGRLKTWDLTSRDHQNCGDWHRETGQSGTLRYGAALSSLAMSGLAFSAPWILSAGTVFGSEVGWHSGINAVSATPNGASTDAETSACHVDIHIEFQQHASLTHRQVCHRTSSTTVNQRRKRFFEKQDEWHRFERWLILPLTGFSKKLPFYKTGRFKSRQHPTE